MCLGAIDVPARIEPALVAFDPLARRLMGRMGRAGAEIHEEGLCRIGGAQVAEKRNRLVRQIFGEMILLCCCLGRLDVVVVVGEIGAELIGFGAEEAIVAVEALAQGPAGIGTGRRHFLRRHLMPLAQRKGCKALGLEQLRNVGPGGLRHAVVPGIAARQLRNHAHAVGVVIASRQQTRTRGRAHGRRMPVGVEQAIRRQLVDMRRLDAAAVAAQVPIADIVHHDDDHIGRPRGGRGGRFQWGVESSIVKPILPLKTSPCQAMMLPHLHTLHFALRCCNNPGISKDSGIDFLFTLDACVLRLRARAVGSP